MRKQSPPRSRLKRTNKKPPSPSDDSYDALQNVDRCLLIRRYVECQFGGGGKCTFENRGRRERDNFSRTNCKLVDIKQYLRRVCNWRTGILLLGSTYTYIYINFFCLLRFRPLRPRRSTNSPPDLPIQFVPGLTLSTYSFILFSHLLVSASQGGLLPRGAFPPVLF